MNLSDHEAESRVLSASMHSEEACIYVISSLTPQDFEEPLHQTVFDIIYSIYSRGFKPTLVEVIKESHILGKLQGIEHLERIRHISQSFIDDSNIKYWVERVRDKSQLRQLNKIVRKAHNTLAATGEHPSSQELLIDIYGQLTNLAMTTDMESGDDFADMLKQELTALEQRIVEFQRLQQEDEGYIPLRGLSTGIAKLDSITLGMKAGDLILLGAQTGHGKSAFALNIAKTVAFDRGQSLLYINTEMRKDAITTRIMGIASGVECRKIQLGDMTGEEYSRMLVSLGKIQEKKFIHEFQPNLTPAKCSLLARKYKVQNNIRLMIVDYIGRMDKLDPKLKEWQVLEQIVKSQKIIAQELDVAVIVLAQLNEDGSLQGAKRIKNECDLLLKLMPIMQDQKEYFKHYEDANYQLYVDKNRDGEAGNSIPLCFKKETQQIWEASRYGGWDNIGTPVEIKE